MQSKQGRSRYIKRNIRNNLVYEKNINIAGKEGKERKDKFENEDK
jgi:hypothetical protein